MDDSMWIIWERQYSYNWHKFIDQSMSSFQPSICRRDSEIIRSIDEVCSEIIRESEDKSK